MTTQNQISSSGHESLAEPPSSTPYKWWQAALVGVAANFISLLPAGFNGNEAFYNQFTQPDIAPPDWVFPPVWLFNNITSLYAGLKIANMPLDTPGRKPFLMLEGAGWILFAVFTPLYFGLKSPILGAVDTVAGLAVTAGSFAIASKLNRKAALGIFPRLAWLMLASYVSVYIATHNKDLFFK